MHHQYKAAFSAVFIVLVMLFSGIAALDHGIVSPKLDHSSIQTVNGSAFNLPADMKRMAPVKVSPNSVQNNSGSAYSGKVSVMVTFSFHNKAKLADLLSNISSPNSPGYHKYLTRAQFASEFSISPTAYSQAVDYFSSFPGLNIKTYADRVSIGVSGPANQISRAFNTSLITDSSDPSAYFASSAPELPMYIASSVSGVTGLSNAKMATSSNLYHSAPIASAPTIQQKVNGGYPAPLNSNGVQYLYGSDLQAAYNEQTLLNMTYPTHEVIATILWAGTNSSGKPVGPFVPSDIYSYYNATLPSYEPHSKVYGVPLNGAVKPGPSASYDTTGANQENTLDLEMAGSTAPGSSIYNVYGPNSTYESIDSAFAFILSPNSTYSALNNVSVISNSWGSSEFNCTAWYQHLQEAQARGISVLASSGDSGDNNASSKYTGSQVEFPSAMAYNNFGVTAVGGTTLTLKQNLHILNQTAWYISSSDTADHGPAGSTGGISTVFKEPNFQLNSEANKVLAGRGRGIPDISAIANNTIVTITINGTQYNSAAFWGTSIASPVEAGIVAEIDAVLNHYNKANLGYLNPMLYSLANKEISTPQTSATTGYIATGSYNSSLPTLPFYNVVHGRNHVYNASFGYNLVTGWGSIDAYNLTMYLLYINQTKSANKLKGVDDSLALNGLNVTSYCYNSTTKSYTTVNTYFNASIQQNLFLANQFGAPIYWIQNVIYINGSQKTGWTVNYTGWVVYPFYGLYPLEALYEYNYPAGKIIHMPHTFNVSTWISNYSALMHQTINFKVNSHIISMPVPGAAYIIDSYNYSYELQGKKYYNGPYPDNPYPGGLNPQFGLVGGPSDGKGRFKSPTGGHLSAFIEPMDMNSYLAARTQPYNLSVDETGESASNLNFVNSNGNNWNLSIKNGSSLQGILDYAAQQYSANFTETGLPSGTIWYVNLSNGMDSGAIKGTSYAFNLPNGTYSYSIATNDKFYQPSSGSISVRGNSISKVVKFSEAKYTVTFKETGLPSGTAWYINMKNGTNGASAPSAITFFLSDGTYSFTVDNVSGYSISVPSGSISVNGHNVSKTITFSPSNKSTPSTGNPKTEQYVIATSILLIIIIALALIMITRRK